MLGSFWFFNEFLKSVWVQWEKSNLARVPTEPLHNLQVSPKILKSCVGCQAKLIPREYNKFAAVYCFHFPLCFFFFFFLWHFKWKFGIFFHVWLVDSTIRIWLFLHLSVQVLKMFGLILGMRVKPLYFIQKKMSIDFSSFLLQWTETVKTWEFSTVM